MERSNRVPIAGKENVSNVVHQQNTAHKAVAVQKEKPTVPSVPSISDDLVFQMTDGEDEEEVAEEKKVEHETW